MTRNTLKNCNNCYKNGRSDTMTYTGKTRNFWQIKVCMTIVEALITIKKWVKEVV